MTVESEITRIKGNIETICNSIQSNYGITIDDKNTDNLSQLIPSMIPESNIVVLAQNKTGHVIQEGDKVWLNETSTEADNSYTLEEKINYSPEYGPVLSPTGLFAWFYGKLYGITSTSSTEVGNFAGTPIINNIHYIDENTICINNQYAFSEDVTATYSRPMVVGSNYIMSNSGSVISKINPITGETITDYTITTSNSYTPYTKQCVCFNNIIYNIQPASSAYDKRYSFNDEDSTCQADLYNINSHLVTVYTLGNLPDKNIALVRTNKNLRFIEQIDDKNLRVWSQMEMPVDLQPYYSKDANYVFNPYSGILTAISSPTDYTVVQYKDGKWTKLAVDLQLDPEFPVDSTGYLTIANDLSRAALSFKYDSSGDNKMLAKIINLKITNSLIAQSYKPYTITENTITGYALSTADPDTSFSVSIGKSK